MILRCQIEMTNFVNGEPIIGKAAIFDRSTSVKHWLAFYLFRMILMIYKLFEKKSIMAQDLLKYTANILMNRKGGGVGIAKRSK